MTNSFDTKKRQIHNERDAASRLINVLINVSETQSTILEYTAVTMFQLPLGLHLKLLWQMHK